MACCGVSDVIEGGLYRCEDVTSTVCRPVDLHIGLDKAIAELEEDAAKGRCRGPYLVASRVYESVFELWSLEIESGWKLSFVKEAGKDFGSVWLYGDPSRVHEVVALCVHEMKEQMVSAWYEQGNRGSFKSRDVLLGIGSTRIPLKVDKYVINKEPDVAWVPSQTPNALPSFVLELSYRNESIPRLKEEMRWWSRNGVAITLGIKVEIKRAGNGVLSQRFLLFILDHQDGTGRFRDVNFSPGVCNEENKEDFVQRIPLHKIMRGFPTGLDQDFHFELSLFELQQQIVSLNLVEAPPSRANEDI
ncbi:uncharacterized protein LOC112342307 [Selaginella moellendorffii]|uniref:uncharacterized protein LOC112342307 n=1 Tax=Selaginella moellendorffii TaxID=88036 RepID=UPI000D1CD2C9|nr:uncharacterized protein LOC112342307 [Selaginella moellendorffii]|eukprot:XP_024519685.1 uncharacterized protein LOC112342307 [Selaginella moellendorffii]